MPATAEIAFEETFGPVAILEAVEDADDAVERVNSSRFRLTAAILTGDPYRGIDLARRLESGIVHVNDQPVNDEPQMPFGGVKDSGFGRFGLGRHIGEHSGRIARRLRLTSDEYPGSHVDSLVDPAGDQ